ncbi:MAG: hypothetical protein Q8N77_03670 [Nanoarchaeota archaeon]|nr:hypothetical protein [Nanoarchaeota archaeon]
MAIKSAKKQKKTWFSIVSPKEFGNYIVGETPASEPQSLIGRSVQVNLMTVLNDPKKQNVQLTLKIKSLRENTAITETIRYELLPSYLKRMMRKGRNKIEDSFIAQTKDNINARIKPIMITKTKTQRSKLSLLRKLTREFLIERIKTQNFTEVVNDAISTKLQRELRDKLKKTYPLVVCEFKTILIA